MLQTKWALTIYLVTSVLLTPTTQATTYYVATTGNDSNSCTQSQNANTPRLTIPAGVKCLAGGDTLIIKAGTYTNQQITNPPAGTANQYTVIRGDAGGARPIMAPDGAGSLQRAFDCTNGSACSYIELRHIEVTGAYNHMRIYGTDAIGFPHHLRIIDNIFHDSVHTGINILSSRTGYQGGDHLFRDNEFYRTGVGNPGYGPGHNTIYNPGNRTIVEKNTFHNLANGVGIWLKGLLIQNVILRQNVFYDIGRSSIDSWQRGNGSFSAIHVSVPGGGHQIYNNIIYRSGDEESFTGIRVRNANPGEINHIYNNTIYDIKHTRAQAIRIVPATGTHLVKNNIAYLGGAGIIGGTQSNNLTDDPRFKAPEEANFFLDSMSPGIDAGADVPIATDFAGVLRPQGIGYDIGAYEASNGRGPQTPKQLLIE